MYGEWLYDVGFLTCACVCVYYVASVVFDFEGLWTVAHQAPLSMGIFQARIWSGLPCPPPGDPSNPGIKPTSSTLQADCLPSEAPRKP